MIRQQSRQSKFNYARWKKILSVLHVFNKINSTITAVKNIFKVYEYIIKQSHTDRLDELNEHVLRDAVTGDNINIIDKFP